MATNLESLGGQRRLASSPGALGYVRDRSRKFRGQRSFFAPRADLFSAANPSENNRLLDADCHRDFGGMQPLGPADDRGQPGNVSADSLWLRLAATASQDVEVLHRKRGELLDLHRRSLLTSFGDSGEQEERRMQLLAREIASIAKCVGDCMSRVSTAKAASGDGEKVRRSIIRRLAIELQTLQQETRKDQRRHVDQLQQQEHSRTDRYHARGSADEAFEVLERATHAFATKDLGSTAHQLLINDIEVATHTRDREVLKILQSIQELSVMTSELSMMVIDQGTILDRVDYSMQQTSELMKQGVVELEHAERHQKNSRNWLIIGCLIIACLLMLVLYMLKSL
ncbi:unnamed protein product [Pedinophyceae sp. YPF-701]|nr:unnamed protein product [Pedinophyceae sp. YPF-701]